MEIRTLAMLIGFGGLAISVYNLYQEEQELPAAVIATVKRRTKSG